MEENDWILNELEWIWSIMTAPVPCCEHGGTAQLASVFFWPFDWCLKGLWAFVSMLWACCEHAVSMLWACCERASTDILPCRIVPFCPYWMFTTFPAIISTLLGSFSSIPGPRDKGVIEETLNDHGCMYGRESSPGAIVNLALIALFIWTDDFFDKNTN